jgi:hypothetical protein
MAASEKAKALAPRPKHSAHSAHARLERAAMAIAAHSPASPSKKIPQESTTPELARASSSLQQRVGNMQTESILRAHPAPQPIPFPGPKAPATETPAKPAMAPLAETKPAVPAAKTIAVLQKPLAPAADKTTHPAAKPQEGHAAQAPDGKHPPAHPHKGHGAHRAHSKLHEKTSESHGKHEGEHGKKLHAAHGKHSAKAKGEKAEAAADSEAPVAAGAPQKAGGRIKLHMPEPPSTLSPKAQGRIHHIKAAAGDAAAAHAALPSAGQHVAEARGAVDQPKKEVEAQAQANLVAALDEKPAPSPEIEELCKKIYQVIKDKRPPDEDSLVQAKPEEMAREAGTQVGQGVQSGTNKVQQNYSDINQEPKSGAPQKGQPMDAPPEAVDSPAIGAEQGVPDAVPAGDVSLKQDVDENRQRMDEAGMNKPAAQLVKSGPIAEVRQGQDELEKTAEQGPEQVLAAQKEAVGRAQSDMNSLQQAALDALTASRKHTVKGTSGQQHKMVGSEADMRTQASAEAQAIFTDAQTKVENLLRPLPEKAMQKWDAGKEMASQTFKRELAEVDRRIKERHSGVGGWFTGLLDAATGLPSWVIERYDKAEKVFGDEVCRLAREISTEVNGVVATCEALIKDARKRIADLFAALPKGLQEWAAKEQAKLGSQLDGLQKHASDVRSNFNRDLIKRASEAVQEVREQIADLRKKAGGILGRIVDAFERFIKDPFKFIIEGLLELVGIPPAAFWALVAKIQKVIADIANDPLGFATNLLAAIGEGFKLFFDHILDHLLKGFINWLTGGLADAGVQLPKDASLKSIITFFLQLMGITWPRIRKLLVKHIGEKNVALIEKVYSLLATLIELGPEGIFEMIKEKLNPTEILNQVINAAVSYLVEALIKQVSARIILLFNPVGAIFQALEAIYRVLKWIFVNAARIFHLVETVVNGISNIIAGNIGGMAKAVESALAQLIPPVIDFLADYLGLSGLPNKIKETIIGFQNWIEGLLGKAIGWLVEKGKALLAKLGIGKKEDEKKKDGADGQVGKDMEWTVEEESHHLWVAVKGQHAEAMMASNTKTVADQLKEYEHLAEKQGGKDKGKVLSNIAKARSELKTLNANSTEMAKDLKKAEPKKGKSGESAVEGEEAALIGLLKAIQQDLGLAGDFGTEKNPVPVDWPKPRLQSYPTIYVGPIIQDRGDGIDQSLLEAGDRVAIRKLLDDKQRAEWKGRNEEILAVRPEKQKPLPNGVPVGVASSNWVDVGMKITMTTPGSTGGGGKINDRFRPFGFRPGKEHKDGDHVVERQLSGEDSIENLWPLKSDVNQASGRVLKDMVFKNPKGKDVSMKELKDRARGGKPVIFQVQSTLK